jgi:hypothetical protein
MQEHSEEQARYYVPGKTYLKETEWCDEAAENTPPHSGEVVMIYS